LVLIITHSALDVCGAPKPFFTGTALRRDGDRLRRGASYFIGEKSVGRMYVVSALSNSLSPCSDFMIS